MVSPYNGDKNAIAKIEATMARYPKMGLRAFVAIISEVIPKAGKRRYILRGVLRTRKSVHKVPEILLDNAIPLLE